MKFLKEFESITIDNYGRKLYYQRNDYVFLDLERSYDIQVPLMSPFAKITHVAKNYFDEPYEIVTPDNSYLRIGINDILRKMTKEETEQWEMITNVSKYKI